MTSKIKSQKRKADKIVLVDAATHKKLKVRAASSKESTTIGELIKKFVNTPKEQGK